MRRTKKSKISFIALATAAAVGVAGLVVAQSFSVTGDPVVLTYDSQRLSDTRDSSPVAAGGTLTVAVPAGESINVVLTAVQPSSTGYLSFDGGTTSALSWSGTGNASTLAHAYTGGAETIEVFASVETDVLVDLVYIVNKGESTTPTTTPVTTPTTTPVTTPPTTPVTTPTTTPVTTPPTTTPVSTTPTTTTAPVTTTMPPTNASTYVQSFDTAASLNDMVFEVTDSRPFSGAAGMSWTGDHAAVGDSCGAPETQRPLDSKALDRDPATPTRFDNDLVRNEGFVYWCELGNQHIMTSFNSTGYFHMDFRPAQTFTDVSRICWDQNVTSMGGKWTEVAIIPVDTFNANGQRMDYTHPDRNNPGEPGGLGLQIRDGVWKGQFDPREMDSSNNQSTDRSSRLGTTTQDRRLRTQHCVTDNGNGTVTMQRGTWDGGTQTAVLKGTFPAGEAVVVWSDVGYNPNKRNDHEVDENTWHWDNLIIESA